jgi:phospholipid/cholesterol/gamma-HCH transport system substrate-binding protein
LVSDLRQLSGRANTLLTRVNNGQGTLARLIDDDQLYYSVVNTLQNIEVATRRLQPIIEDARVFSDKIAREPSSLINIRGAITGQRGGMK